MVLRLLEVSAFLLNYYHIHQIPHKKIHFSLPNLSKYLNDAFEPNMTQLEKLNERSTHIERGAVERLTDEGESVGLVMADGRMFSLAGLFIVTETDPSQLAIRLGCELEVTPLGRVVKINASKATSVPGVFACGDIARPVGNVSLAVSDGA